MADEQRASASAAYAMGQLLRAIESLATAKGPQDRARLEVKIFRWRSVLDGTADGTLTVGSRTPVSGTPAWVTLEVAHGGFVSGRYLAEAPLQATDGRSWTGLVTTCLARRTGNASTCGT